MRPPTHTTPTDPTDPTDPAPSIAEIAALTTRLRALTGTGRDTDPDARVAFLAAKAALLARIPNPDQPERLETSR